MMIWFVFWQVLLGPIFILIGSLILFWLSAKMPWIHSIPAYLRIAICWGLTAAISVHSSYPVTRRLSGHSPRPNQLLWYYLAYGVYLFGVSIIAAGFVSRSRNLFPIMVLLFVVPGFFIWGYAAGVTTRCCESSVGGSHRRSNLIFAMLCLMLDLFLVAAYFSGTFYYAATSESS